MVNLFSHFWGTLPFSYIVMQSQIKISLRPNNQITITKGSWKKAECETTQKDRRNFAKKNVKKFLHQMAVDENIAKTAENNHDLYRYRIESAPLDIIKKFQRKQSPPKSKLNTPKSFTRASGQKLRECGAAMDIACNSDTRFCHEVTLTLPANTTEAFRALASQSGYVINRLFQPIRRDYGNMCLWFFVWEYQKRGALHLHIAIYHPDEAEGLWISAKLIEQWHKILCDLSVRCDTDMFLSKSKNVCTIRSNHQHHCAPIQKAVGAYFSKYAGKSESKNDWYCKAYPVSRFWGSNAPIKSIITANSIQIEFDYHGKEIEANEKFESIIQNIIERLNIVSASQYDFDIRLTGKHRLNRCGNGRKILSVDDDKSIANGTRYTFYFEQIELSKAIELIEIEALFA